MIQKMPEPQSGNGKDGSDETGAGDVLSGPSRRGPPAEDSAPAGEQASGEDPGDVGDQRPAGGKPPTDSDRPNDPVAAGSPRPEPADTGAPGEGSRPLTLRIEAVLFGSGQALSAVRLTRVLDEPLEHIKAALSELAQRWASLESALELVEIAGGWRFMTRPAYQPDLAGLARKAKQERLSPAALETLAVVAYQQPLGRAEIEAVRGVAAGPLLRVLLDRDLIRITGRSPEPGHPLLYGTTRRFLDHFGLRSLKSLPDIKDLLDVS